MATKKINKHEAKASKETKKEIIHKLQEMDIDDIKCGVLNCAPKGMQSLATKNVYLVVYCCVGLVIGMFFTYHVSTISTIEKRFKLSSKLTGIMLAGNDISQIMLAILVAYFGNYGNRPKWLSIGVISAAISCFLSAVPHFVYGPGQDALDLAQSLSASEGNTSLSSPVIKNKIDLCYSPYDGECGENGDQDNSYVGPVIILFIAEFFVGIAVASFYSLGLVYLDDNVNKKDSPLYYAVSMIIRVVGPVLGFFLGSKCLAIYIDPAYKPNISLRDPRWMGAWWLGFLIIGGILNVLGFVMLLFPRTLPSTLAKQLNRIQQKESPEAAPLTRNSDLRYYLGLAKVKQRFTKPSIKKLPSALKRLFTNKIWIGNNFNTVFALLALMGYWSFKPKYLEFQFRKSASTANLYTEKEQSDIWSGIASLIASILGLSISGVIIKVFKPGPRFIAAYSTFLTLFSAASMTSLIFIGCPKLDIIGPNSNMTELGDCNANCLCTDRYSPVCGEDGYSIYYSPCYAGCTRVDRSTSPVEYLDCKCVSPVIVNNISSVEVSVNENAYEVHNVPLSGGKAIQGYCKDDCDAFFTYLIITIITKTIDSTGRIGSTLIYLRSVEEHDKGLALGVSTVLLSLFAFIPAPIIMGAIVDSACIIWDNTCGTKGNCWLYDSDQFRIIIHAFPAVIILLSAIGDIIVFIYSKDLVLYDEKQEQIQQEKELNGMAGTTDKLNEMHKARVGEVGC